eukprot:scaffold142884_cov16-Tisochrysis_lutea.AAC.2
MSTSLTEHAETEQTALSKGGQHLPITLPQCQTCNNFPSKFAILKLEACHCLQAWQAGIMYDSVQEKKKPNTHQCTRYMYSASTSADAAS